MPPGDPGTAEEAAVVPGEPGNPDIRGRGPVPQLLLSGHVPNPHLGTATQSVRGREPGGLLGSLTAWLSLTFSPSLPLLRHKELAPLKYLALEEKLYKDPRLVDFVKVFL